MPTSSPVPKTTLPLLFQLDNHRLGYGDKVVLHSISLQIHAGERVALVGESGAGKSTLLKRFYEQQRAATALCPQQLGLVPMLSAFHNIYMGRLDRHGFFYNLRNLIKPHPRERQRIGELAKGLGLEEQLFHSVDRLSGGQQQRTALGRALYQQSPIFLGDEPVSAVDEYQARALLQLINEHHETVVVALHDMELALAHFDRIIALRRGEVVLDGRTEDLCVHDLKPVYQP